MVANKCLVCGSSNFRADRALSGRLVCNSCGTPFGVGRRRNNKSTIYKNFSLNNKYFQKNKPTDVLSFPLYKDLTRILELNRDHEEDLGDMFINRKIVKNQAQIYEKSFVDELQFIIIHGLLHLVGYSHENEKELRKTEDKLMEVIWNGS